VTEISGWEAGKPSARGKAVGEGKPGGRGWRCPTVGHGRLLGNRLPACTHRQN